MLTASKLLNTVISDMSHMNISIIFPQRYVRRFIFERRFQKMRMGLVLLQSHARRKVAAAELKRLRTEAKSMDHLKKLNKGLENKIIELQQRITEQVRR